MGDFHDYPVVVSNRGLREHLAGSQGQNSNQDKRRGKKRKVLSTVAKLAANVLLGSVIGVTPFVNIDFWEEDVEHLERKQSSDLACTCIGSHLSTLLAPAKCVTCVKSSLMGSSINVAFVTSTNIQTHLNLSLSPCGNIRVHCNSRSSEPLSVSFYQGGYRPKKPMGGFHGFRTMALNKGQTGHLPCQSGPYGHRGRSGETAKVPSAVEQVTPKTSEERRSENL
ncbi:unnamed protein product [Dovyalis caffra]|uniref:Uncharacterized protein n=1 Tax=Dovyalis caffra TaxID=77055 RepID=A0AAV1QYC0_9ROSI|nr:unnamed protein product [Dovyalis caffra]